MGAANYLVLQSTLTDATAGIQIYTDNKNAGASIVYPTVAGDSQNPAGLVTISTTVATLPMCWRLTDNTTGALTIAQGAPSFPDRLYVTELGNAFPCFFWMEDKSTVANPDTHTAAFANSDDYITVKDAARGGHFAEGNNWGAMASPDYIYLGANFSNAVQSAAGVNYGANIKIEAFTE